MAAAQLTDDQVQAIREKITTGGTRDEAAAVAGIRRSLLERHLRDGQLADLRGGRRWRPPTPDPTPAEIAARAKARRDETQGRPKKDSGKLVQKSAPEKTRDEIAKVANVSHDTVAKVKKIDAAEKAGKVDAERWAGLNGER